MRDCPIGLICSDFECNRRYCENLADPWPLPYYLNPRWMPGVGLLVIVPSHEWDCTTEEHLIAQNEEYNNWVTSVRNEMWMGGFWYAIDLPYEVHPEGGLLVIHDLKLDGDVTFSEPWIFNPKKRYNCAPTHWEEFMRPVPLEGCRHPFTADYIEKDGFYRDFLLRFLGDFDESYEE
ncbi:MAG: hypothetical protein V7K27_35670 [Nostoc sp.]|uniref:hypothetical protein n=1 Tax=Nostoc sp. TaxID=1180 RepID=UPI002FF92379